MEKSSHIL